MITTTTRLRRLAAVTAAVALSLSACGSDEAEPSGPQPSAPSIDDLNVDSDIEEGVDTETDEGRNQGFEADEDSGSGQNLED